MQNAKVQKEKIWISLPSASELLHFAFCILHLGFPMAEDPNAIQTDELKARVGSLRRYL